MLNVTGSQKTLVSCIKYFWNIRKSSIILLFDIMFMDFYCPDKVIDPALTCRYPDNL